MRNKIHYEDDLFFLNLQMKGVAEGLKLAIDADYFQDKILADLRFLDATLNRLYSTLKDNVNLIHRAEYLYQLVKSEGIFVEVMGNVLAASGEVSQALEPYKAEFAERRASHEADIQEIRVFLKLASQDEEREDVITLEELALLTRPDEDEEKS